MAHISVIRVDCVIEGHWLFLGHRDSLHAAQTFTKSVLRTLTKEEDVKKEVESFVTWIQTAKVGDKFCPLSSTLALGLQYTAIERDESSDFTCHMKSIDCSHLTQEQRKEVLEKEKRRVVEKLNRGEASVGVVGYTSRKEKS